MISITCRGQFIFLNNRLRQMGLSAGQFPVLMLLSKEQNIIPETRVRYYHLDKGTIARAVRKLEDTGLSGGSLTPITAGPSDSFLLTKASWRYSNCRQ
jgi:hypothetical protein